MGLIQEFKEFALRGNVVDMTVGVIVGGAFGKIITSLVNDVVMPPIGILLAGVDFKELKFVLKPESLATSGKVIKEVAITYGDFIQTTVDFVIVAFVIFIAIKLMYIIRKPSAQTPLPPQEQLLTEIRDLLKEKSTT